MINNIIPFVDLKSQYKQIKNEIDSAISTVINETSFINGRHVKDFENNFKLKYGVKHCISVANGTDALYITMKMLGIGHGDEVITTATSWISSSETISQTGAKPVFVDIDDYYTIDVEKIEEKINPNTKAIIPVHLYGQSCNMEIIMQIAEKNNLYIIEDCAQSHFSQFKSKNVGLFGVASTFSFYPGKNLGAYGDAGCILTNNDDLALKCRMYANHGALIKHEHKIEGINSRMDGIQAAILNVKLKYINDWNEQRVCIANQYFNSLKNIEQIELPKVRKNTKHTFHLFVIRLDSRDKLMNFLKKHGVSTALHYPTALPLLEAYKKQNNSVTDFKNAYKHQQIILSLPIYPELKKIDVDYVCSIIKQFYEK